MCLCPPWLVVLWAEGGNCVAAEKGEEVAVAATAGGRVVVVAGAVKGALQKNKTAAKHPCRLAVAGAVAGAGQEEVPCHHQVGGELG